MTVKKDKPILFAVDFGRKTTDCGVAGSSWTKIFESGYEASDMSSGDEEEVFQDGKYYLFSGRGEAEAYPLESDRMLRCTNYGVLSYLSDSNADPALLHEVILGGNVPMMTYGIEKYAFIDYYPRAEQTATFKGKEWKFKYINVQMFPQDVVGYVGRSKDYSKYKMIQVIGIGSRTVTGFKVDRTGKKIQYIDKFMDDGLGVLSMLDNIKGRLEQSRIYIPESTIEEALKGKKPDHKKADEILNVAADKKEQYVDRIVNTLHEKKYDLEAATLLIGGGADAVAEELSERMYIVGSLGILANMEGIRASLEKMYGSKA